jgi:hypothetical protein
MRNHNKVLIVTGLAQEGVSNPEVLLADFQTVSQMTGFAICSFCGHTVWSTLDCHSTRMPIL